MNQTSSLGVFGWLAQALISIFKMITKSMSVVEKTVNMAHNSVEVAAEEQTIELTLKRTDMRKRLVDQATLRAAQQEEQMQQYAGKSDQHRAMMNDIRTKLEADVDKALAYQKAN